MRRDCSRAPLPGTPAAEAASVAPGRGTVPSRPPAVSGSQSRRSDKWPVRREDGGWGQDQQEKGRERSQNAPRRASLSRRGERPLAGAARREHPRVARPACANPRHRSNSGAALGPWPRHQVGPGAPVTTEERAGLQVPRTGAPKGHPSVPCTCSRKGQRAVGGKQG